VGAEDGEQQTVHVRCERPVVVTCIAVEERATSEEPCHLQLATTVDDRVAPV
jgi:hypothetical protein